MARGETARGCTALRSLVVRLSWGISDVRLPARMQITPSNHHRSALFLRALVASKSTRWLGADTGYLVGPVGTQAEIVLDIQFRSLIPAVTR
jgi:hypothetical protein